MLDNFLELLCCLQCESSLILEVIARSGTGIEKGALRCKSCSRAYPIIDGIPRFVSQREMGGEMGTVPISPPISPELMDTQERFAFEWLRYPGTLPEDEEIFLNETQIEKSVWRGRWVLDAGCGMGRYARVAHALGANVVALDLGSALERLKDLAVPGAAKSALHLVQGDLLHLPLKKGAFDIIYSLGVIHHTPSPRKCVKELALRLKEKGQLSLWVYGKGGSYKYFKTNPLREERKNLKGYLWLVWLIVLLREKLSGMLRFFTVRLPHKLLYSFCYPLALLGKIPLLKYLAFSVHPVWRVRLQENFDWLAPPTQSHHTKEEVAEWFKENNLEVLKILPHGFVPKVGLLGMQHE